MCSKIFYAFPRFFLYVRRSIGLIGAVVCLIAAPGLFAGGKSERQAAAPADQKLVVVASTSWVAAIARAGGAENIRILAPVELKHPPEYELKPSDLTAVSKADMILYAGWEMFAEKLAETAGSAKVQLVQVNTSNNPEDLKTEARKLAERFGTLDRFEAWSRDFDRLTAELRPQILAAYPDKRAVVQRMQTPFAVWLGLDIIGEYGPAEPSAAVILELVQLHPALIIDNYHGPSGQPIAEAANAPYAELLNFPGKDGTQSIEDLFRYNADVLIHAAAR
ncbi:MAG: zinc ABC transporter substrate-binding protein [Treponema sp.]|jgi:ABC-type Fe3+-hydroxamate transport system substrate-binding protein|nr:zinc ABC transporter substrate-binding protein [Treponema sp.]